MLRANPKQVVLNAPDARAGPMHMHSSAPAAWITLTAVELAAGDGELAASLLGAPAVRMPRLVDSWSGDE